MNKRLSHVLKLIFIVSTLIMFMAVMPKQKYLQKLLMGMSFIMQQLTGSRIISTADFNSEVSTWGDAELYIWARSIGTPKSLGGFQFQIVLGDGLRITSGPTLLQKKDWTSGRDSGSVLLYSLISSGDNKYLIGKKPGCYFIYWRI